MLKRGNDDILQNVMKIKIPQKIEEILSRLEGAGFEAFIVGGCVRDSLLGRAPGDWDVCTSARPDQIKACFSDCRTVDTGISHGTVTVVRYGEPVEVTTYRIDGTYSDGRRPDSVEFTGSLEEDLARRDFTVNAMACDMRGRLVDPYGGRADLKAGILRCVGEPERRFDEDALRVIRALRFAAVLGFELAEQTDVSVSRNAARVRLVSPERIGVEFSKLLLGSGAGRILARYGGELTEAIGLKLAAPERSAAIDALPFQLPVRLAFVLEDVTADGLRKLRYDNATIRKTLAVRAAATVPLAEDRAGLKKLLRRYGAETVANALAIKRLEGVDTAAAQRDLREIVDGGECYSLEGLAVGGRDLLDAGFTAGPQVGIVLEELLDEVIEGRIVNETAELLAAAAAKNRS